MDKELLMGEARRLGICAEGFGRMCRATDRSELVDYYVANPDWCMERDFPTLEMLTEGFADCEDKGVFVNKTFGRETLCGRQAYIFHNCRGTVRVAMDYERAIIPMLYIANGCRLRIVCEQKENKGAPIRVPVYVFGENEVDAQDGEFGEFRIKSEGLEVSE